MQRPSFHVSKLGAFDVTILFFRLLQRLEYLCVNFVHIEGLKVREGSFHPKKRNDRLVHSFDGYDEITFPRLD